VPVEFAFCPHCGSEIETVCPACNKTMEKDWKVCPYCGEKKKKA